MSDYKGALPWVHETESIRLRFDVHYSFCPETHQVEALEAYLRECRLSACDFDESAANPLHFESKVDARETFSKSAGEWIVDALTNGVGDFWDRVREEFKERVVAVATMDIEDGNPFVSGNI